MNIQLQQTVQDLFLKTFADGKIVLIEGLGYIFPVVKGMVEIKNPATGVVRTIPPSIYISSITTASADAGSQEATVDFKRLLTDAGIEVHVITLPESIGTEDFIAVTDSNDFLIMSVTTQVRPERKGFDPATHAAVTVPQALMRKIDFNQEFKETVRENVKTGLQFSYAETNPDDDASAEEDDTLPVGVRIVTI